MSRSSVPATRRERRARARTARPRTLLAAALCSAGVTLGFGLAVFLTQLALPGTPLRNLWDLEVLNRQVSPGNPLYARFLAEVQRQDMLYFTWPAVLCGGLALGRLAPRAAGRWATLKAAAWVAGGVLLLCLASAWGETLVAQRGRLRAHEIDAQLALAQGGLLVLWTGVYLVGTLAGLWWRDRGRDARPSPS